MRSTRNSVSGPLAVTMALTLLLAAPAVVSAAGSGDSPGAWKTVAASKQVEARPAIQGTLVWTSVSRGDELLPQTLVRTGRRGTATLTRDSSVLIVDSSSQIELPAPGLSSLPSSVIQTEGSVLYEVDSRLHPHFEVVTPRLVAGVKGTAFLVTVDRDYTSITVQRGLVEVTNNRTGERVSVHPGESLIQAEREVQMELVRGDDQARVRSARREARTLARIGASREARGDPERTALETVDAERRRVDEADRDDRRPGWLAIGGETDSEPGSEPDTFQDLIGHSEREAEELEEEQADRDARFDSEYDGALGDYVPLPIDPDPEPEPGPRPDPFPVNPGGDEFVRPKLPPQQAEQP